jgi:hydroxyacylglutathione hydrolase
MAAWEVNVIPALEDNYIFLIHNSEQAMAVDPGESAPLLAHLESRKLQLHSILLTHHHWDHVDGVEELRQRTACQVWAGRDCAARLKFSVDQEIPAEGNFRVLLDLESFTVPGHTLDHLAFYSPELEALFTGDLLFSLGCGRLFEGTYEQGFASLAKLKKFPHTTKVFAAHNYFKNNASFCEAQGLSTKGYHYEAPLHLEQERQFNPFLRAQTLAEFRALREARNKF